ncbi:MAG: hypothetical protein KKF95_00900 [Nanoarchaeota archaeon]|nr:hypothetical protein [Nanoarchaeota archaeon]
MVINIIFRKINKNNKVLMVVIFEAIVSSKPNSKTNETFKKADGIATRKRKMRKS